MAKASATSATTDRTSSATTDRSAVRHSSRHSRRRATDRGLTPLERLVDDPTTFAEQAWGRIPKVTRRGVDHRDGFEDLFSVDDADAFVARSVRRPSVRMVRDGSVLDAGAYCATTRLGGQPVDDVVDSRKVAAQLASGATLVMQSLHRQWDPVVAFADDLTAEIGHPVQINAYLTPGNAAGLRTHSDNHDVFVIQIDGSKRWNVDGLGEVDVKVGDVLYVPAGCAHSAATGGELSLHLTVGVLRLTYRSVIDRMLRDGPATLDDPLPLAFHTDRDARVGGAERSLESGITRVLSDVITHLHSTPVAEVADRERLRQLVPHRRRGHVGSVLAVTGLDDDTVLRWVDVAPRMQPVPGEPGRVRVLLADRVLQMPEVACPAIDALSAAVAGTLAVGDLPDLDPPSRLVLGRRLVLEGACVIEPVARI